jgi:hypothetical protein
MVINVQRLVSWISIGLMLFIGLLFLTGYVPLANPSLRLVFGVVIVLYAGIRSVLLLSSQRAGGKKP